MHVIDLNQLAKNSQGSPWGITTYLRAAECAHRHNLARQYADVGEMEVGTRMLVGIMVHKLLELQDKNKLTQPIQVSDTANNACAQEALAIFREYNRQYAAGFFGNPVGVELELSTLAGAAPLTGRLDRLDNFTAEDIDRISHKHPLLLEPGIYIRDYKTTNQYNIDQILDKYRHSLQFVAYHYLLTRATPHKSNGTLVHLFRSQKRKTGYKIDFELINFPPPTESDYAVLEQFIIQTHDEIMADKRRFNACVGAYSVCPFKTSGLCRGTTE